MAKFYGRIGYNIGHIENPPGSGIYVENIVEKMYCGDVLKNNSRWNDADERLNDNLNIQNRFSIVADPFAYQNFSTMRYIEWLGVLWKIKSVDVNRPRLTLEVGGVYNAPTD